MSRRAIPNWILFATALALGFATKVSVVEVALLTSTHYVNMCFDETKPTTAAAETHCYEAPRRHALYRTISFFNAQPSFWKNTLGRCVGTKGTKADAYFECAWWNRFAL